MIGKEATEAGCEAALGLAEGEDVGGVKDGGDGRAIRGCESRAKGRRGGDEGGG